MISKNFVIWGGYGQFTDRFSRCYSDQADNQGPGPLAHLAENYNNQMVNGQPLFSFPNRSRAPALLPRHPANMLPRCRTTGITKRSTSRTSRSINSWATRVFAGPTPAFGALA